MAEEVLILSRRRKTDTPMEGVKGLLSYDDDKKGGRRKTSRAKSSFYNLSLVRGKRKMAPGVRELDLEKKKRKARMASSMPSKKKKKSMLTGRFRPDTEDQRKREQDIMKGGLTPSSPNSLRRRGGKEKG